MSANNELELEKWKILSRRKIYECAPFLRLEKQVVELPDGRLIDDYHWLQMPDYCVVCAFTNDKRIITLRGYRHGAGRVTSYLPGGLVDKDEEPLIAAKRELLEETGYEVSECQAMGSYIPHGSYGCGRVHLFKATNARKVREPNSGDLEEMVIDIIEFETILNWIRTGRIQSLASMAAIVGSIKGVF